MLQWQISFMIWHANLLKIIERIILINIISLNFSIWYRPCYKRKRLQKNAAAFFYDSETGLIFPKVLLEIYYFVLDPLLFPVRFFGIRVILYQVTVSCIRFLVNITSEAAFDEQIVHCFPRTVVAVGGKGFLLGKVRSQLVERHPELRVSYQLSAHVVIFAVYLGTDGQNPD